MKIPFRVPLGLIRLALYYAGIIIRIHLCWNFGGLVPGTLTSYRYQLKTPGSYLLGAHFGHKTSPKYGGLRPFKTVLVLILGLLSDRLQTL